MNGKGILRSPLSRAAFLTFAVLATVATSSPSWSLASEAINEDVELAPGATFVRKVQYEASHRTTLTTRVSGTSELGAKIRIFQAGALPSCSAEEVYVPAASGKWTYSAYDGRPLDRVVQVTSSCVDERGTFTVSVRNEGTSSADVHVNVVATIGEDGHGDQPDGAFVRASVVP